MRRFSHEAAGATIPPNTRPRQNLERDLSVPHPPWPRELTEAFVTWEPRSSRRYLGPATSLECSRLQDVVDRWPTSLMPTFAGDWAVSTNLSLVHARNTGPGCRLAIGVESDSHMPFIEEPARFDRVMRVFFGCDASRRATSCPVVGNQRASLARVPWLPRVSPWGSASQPSGPRTRHAVEISLEDCGSDGPNPPAGRPDRIAESSRPH